MTDIPALLKSYKQKITPTRIRLLEQLSRAAGPLSAYQLHELVTDKPIDVATIYRNLELFVSRGLVHKIHSIQSYLRCHHDHCTQSAVVHHSHDLLVCTQCHRIQETHIHDSSQVVDGFFGHSPLEIAGVCGQCADDEI